MNIPAISVIVPLYNAEKYICECLDSLLIQTFQNFEVIVVDDCSTDNGVKIVQGYAPKFEGRLKLAKTKENSGGGGYVPRNIGLKLASGEYIFFLDSDDFILGTALETVYNAAKKYDADVVYTGACYQLKQPDDAYLWEDGEHKKLIRSGLEDKISLTIDEPGKNIRRLLLYKNGNYRTPWAKLIQRKFLLENEIFFPEIVTGGDFIWVINVYCHAKRFLRLPIPLYFYRRYNADSVSHVKGTPSEQIAYTFSNFIAWLNAFQELSAKNDTLSQTSLYRYLAPKSTFKYRLDVLSQSLGAFPVKEMYDVLCKEFAQNNNSCSLVIPFLLSFIYENINSSSVSSKTTREFKKSASQSQERISKMLRGLKKSVAQSQKRITELENEIKQLKMEE